MSTVEILLLIALVALIAICSYLLLKVNKIGNKEEEDTAVKLLQQQLLDLNKQIDSKLSDTNKTLVDQLNQSNTSIRQQFAMSQKIMQESKTSAQQVVKELTHLGETNKQVVKFAEQLQSLENILKNPKRRGILGEYYLETVLKNVLPPDAYSLQYKFSNGEIVDALVRTREGTIPIDAKFSLENYNSYSTAETKEDRERYAKLFKQDIKNRIDETSKYIRPEEGTLDFAFMFIPADGLYYDLLVQKIGALEVNSTGLIEYAFKKRVLIVSPTTFFAYLQTVMQGLRALKIEESTKDIQKQVGLLQKHLSAYEEHFTRVGKHMTTTVNAYNRAGKEFGKIDRDLLKITGSEESISENIEQPDAPQLLSDQ